MVCALIPITEVLAFVVGCVGSVGVDSLTGIGTIELAVTHLLVHPVGRAISYTRLVAYGGTRSGLVTLCVKITYKVVAHDRIHLIIFLVAKDAEVVVTRTLQSGSSSAGVARAHLETDDITSTSITTAFREVEITRTAGHQGYTNC